MLSLFQVLFQMLTLHLSLMEHSIIQWCQIPVGSDLCQVLIPAFLLCQIIPVLPTGIQSVQHMLILKFMVLWVLGHLPILLHLPHLLIVYLRICKIQQYDVFLHCHFSCCLVFKKCFMLVFKWFRVVRVVTVISVFKIILSFDLK